jgi:hypothetical protein
MRGNLDLTSIDVSSLSCVGSYYVNDNGLSDDAYLDLLSHLTDC